MLYSSVGLQYVGVDVASKGDSLAEQGRGVTAVCTDVWLQRAELRHRGKEGVVCHRIISSVFMRTSRRRLS